MEVVRLDGLSCLDIRSIIFATAIVTLVLSLGMCAVARLHPEIQGTKYWSIGCALQAIGWLLFDLRGYAPDFLTVFLGSLLPIASLGYFYLTFVDFKKEKPKRLWMGSILAATTVALLVTFLPLPHPHIIARIACASLGASAMVLLCIHALVTQGGEAGGEKPSPNQRLTAILLSAGLAILLLRAGLALAGAEFIADYVQRAIFNRLLYAGIDGAVVLVTFGYLAMCHDRFRTETMHLATTDPLTSALNRRAMETVLDTEMRRALRDVKPLSLLLLDLDHFKHVNDTFGHAVGDRVLRSAVEAIGHHLRPVDRIARWGGEEFLITLSGTGMSEAIAIAEKVRGAIRKLLVHDDSAETHGSGVPLSVSIGVADYHPEDSTYDSLLRRADKALYAAKNAGRDRVASAPAAASQPRSGAPGVVHAGAGTATQIGGADRDKSA